MWPWPSVVDCQGTCVQWQVNHSTWWNKVRACSTSRIQASRGSTSQTPIHPPTWICRSYLNYPIWGTMHHYGPLCWISHPRTSRLSPMQSHPARTRFPSQFPPRTTGLCGTHRLQRRSCLWTRCFCGNSWAWSWPVCRWVSSPCRHLTPTRHSCLGSRACSTSARRSSTVGSSTARLSVQSAVWSQIHHLKNVSQSLFHLMLTKTISGLIHIISHWIWQIMGMCPSLEGHLLHLRF